MAAAGSTTTKFYHGFPTPGPQSPHTEEVLKHVFFASDAEWKAAREILDWDYIVVGSGFCALAFVDATLKKNPKARILIVERGPFFLPEHFQNLPPVFKLTLPDERYLSETFPWTLSKQSSSPTDPRQAANWTHGMVPFFGGRSTLWSAWCPRPSEAHGELLDWPAELKSLLTDEFYRRAESLLNVTPVDQLEDSIPAERRLYNTLQKKLQAQLIDAVGKGKVNYATRAMAAPLATDDKSKLRAVDFGKFSVVGPLLELSKKHPNVLIATNCTVERIIHQDGTATALKTSRGVLPVREAKVILALGCLPATSLLLESIPTPLGVEPPGAKFSSHFISAIVARVKRSAYDFQHELRELEIGALYAAGLHNKQQFHAQISIITNTKPREHEVMAFHYMPDVVATASQEQLDSSSEYVIFVLAILGELDVNNKNNWFKRSPDNSSEPGTNCTLQFVLNETDYQTWDAMDEFAFAAIDALLPNRKESLEYWVSDSTGAGKWQRQMPTKNQRRVPGMVHESSTLRYGTTVRKDFRPHGLENVYVTGAGLWPTGASWNPTMVMCGLAQHLADTLSAGQNTVTGKSLSEHTNHKKRKIRAKL